MSEQGKHEKERRAISPILKSEGIQEARCEYTDAPDAIITLQDGRKVGIEVIGSYKNMNNDKFHERTEVRRKFVHAAITAYEKNRHNLMLDVTISSQALNTVSKSIKGVKKIITKTVWQELDDCINGGNIHKHHYYIEHAEPTQFVGGISWVLSPQPIPFDYILCCINKKEIKLDSYKKLHSDIDEYWLIIDIVENDEYSVFGTEINSFQSEYTRIYINAMVAIKEE